jgi:hypothetical protein
MAIDQSPVFFDASSANDDAVAADRTSLPGEPARRYH